MDKTLSQKNLVNLVNFVEQEIVTDYRSTCELLMCHVYSIFTL